MLKINELEKLQLLEIEEEMAKKTVYCIDCYMKSLTEDGFYHYMGEWYNSKRDMLETYSKNVKEFDKAIVRECTIINVPLIKSFEEFQAIDSRLTHYDYNGYCSLILDYDVSEGAALHDVLLDKLPHDDQLLQKFEKIDYSDDCIL